MTTPIDLEAGQNGELYLLDLSGHIFRLGVDGRLELIAGGGDQEALDGRNAAEVFLPGISRISFGRDGRLYFVEQGFRARRIEGDGTLTTVAGPRPMARGGGFEAGIPEEGDFLLDNSFLEIADLAAGADGRTYLADTQAAQVVAGELAFPSFSSDDLRIADGDQIYEFDRRGRHLRTRHALTGAMLYEFGYDRQGLLISIEDGSGNVTTIERETNGQASAIVSPFGQRTVLTIDASGWLAEVENPNHETEHFQYRLGLVVEKEDARGNHKVYEYSDLGRLVTMRDEENRVRRMSLIGRFGWPDNSVTLEGANTQETTYTVRNRPDGSVYRSQISPEQLFSSTTTYRDGSSEGFSHGVSYFVRKRPDPRLGESSAYPALSWIEMAEGLRSETRMSIDAPLNDPTDPWSFDEIATLSETNGRLTSSIYSATARTLTTVSPEGRMVSLGIDQLARPIRFEAPEVEAWTASYQDSGEIEELVIGTGLAARRTRFGYDPLHRVETIEDAEERTVTFGYDGANRVTSTLLPDGKTVGFAYDANGNVTQVTPPGRPAHVFTYTPRNQLETYTLPDAGAGVAVEERIYDKSKRLQEVHRPDGKIITFEYQAVGDRLKRIVSPRGNTDFEFDPLNGLVSKITEPDGQQLNFQYQGTLLEKTTWTGEVSGSVSRTYDENFRVKTISVNDRDPVEYVYDDDNQLIQVGEMTITRDRETGRETDTRLGKVTTHRTYTNFGEPETYTAKFEDAEIYFERYEYNKLGWITDLERRQNGFHELLHYEYDDRGRLAEVWRDGALESSYTYDDNSNRLSYTGPLGNATGTYDDRDRMLTYGGASYTWSEAGELTSKSEGGETTTYDYDVFGNLRKVVLPNGIEIEYLTDGAQRRIGKKVNGVLVKQWLYLDQLEPVAELDGSGNVLNEFAYGTRSHVPDFLERGVESYRFISDYLGSPRLVIDAASGLIAQDIRFQEYGITQLNSNPAFQSFGYAGGLADGNTKLVRFGARDVDPENGRWLKYDPVGFYADRTNLLIYSGDNPVNYYDSTGLYFGFDDALFTGGGFALGLLGQAGSDLLTGEVSGWEDYLGSAIGGAVGGEALLYTGPVGAGIAAGLAGNISKQFLKNQTGKQCGYDLVSLAAETALGGATGLIPGARVPGITSGRGSYVQVFRQMVTKAQNGTARNIVWGTAAKMYVGRNVETAALPGVAVSMGVSSTGLLPNSGVSCPCGE